MPIGPLHLAGLYRADVRTKFWNWLRPLRVGTLTARTPFSLLATGGRLPRWTSRRLRNWPQWTVPRLSPLLGGERPDLLVIDSPFFSFAPGLVEATTVIYRITDHTPGFPDMTPQVLELERAAVGTADLVMVPVQSLAEYARELGARRVVVVPNGVDVRRFTGASPSTALDHVGRPIAIYVGSLRAWFDAELVNRLVAARPGLTVVVAGPRHDQGARDLRPAPNLVLLGAVPHTDVPGLLAAADLALIPFDVERHRDLVDAVDPIKLYEYCAAGLPVVATRWRALSAIGSPALLADDADSFLSLVDEACRRSEELGRDGRRFASRSDWSRRFDDLMAAAGLTGGTRGNEETER